MRQMMLLVKAVALVVALAVAGGCGGGSSQSTLAADARWVPIDLGLAAGSDGPFDLYESVGSAETYAINERGEIVSGGYLWKNGETVDLGGFPGGEGTSARAINDRGEVVGWSTTANGSRHAFLWRGGKMIDLDAGLAIDSEARSINNRGQIVGSSGGHAVMWENGKRHVIRGLPGAETSEAVGINDRGQIIGNSMVHERMDHSGDSINDPWERPFLLQNGGVIDLGTIGELLTEAVAINNLGQVVGNGMDRETGLLMQSFLWEKNRIHPVIAVRPAVKVGVLAINDRGQIVGTDIGAVARLGEDQPGEMIRPTHAVMWQRGTLTYLESQGGDASVAMAINERGQIAGTSTDSTGGYHAALWTLRSG